MRNLGRFFRTVFRLKPVQVFWRARYMIRRRLGRHPRVTGISPVAALNAEALDRLRGFLCLAEAQAPTAETQLTALRSGHFKVLNAEVNGAWAWDALGCVARPGRSAVHWFEYLRPLAQAGAVNRSDADARLAMAWAHDWMAHCPPGAGEAWSAYPIATRLMNWALAFAAFGAPDKALLDSFAMQARWLSRSIEYDVEANHLVRDAQGLIVAGALMAASPEGRGWLRTGLRLLARTLAEQVLADGGHYERSPMYHSHVLEGCLIAYAALETKPAFLRGAILRMADFLLLIAHPDGDIPLFGDVAFDTCMAPAALHATARALCGGTPHTVAEGAYALEPSGFYIMRTRPGAAWMIAKAAAPEPSYQLGHAHADAFSYELSVNGRRVIVDSGNAIYEPNPMRTYCRGVRAHNSVAIDGREPMECWDTFRVARRYHILSRDWRETQDGCYLSAWHDGYAPARYGREIRFHEGGAWLIGDIVTAGRPCRAESYIHFHPDVWVEPRGGGYAAIAGSDETLILPFGAGRIEQVRGVESPPQGWYCPRFGETTPSECLILHAEGRAFRFGYAIVPPCADAQTRRVIEDYCGQFLAGTT